MSFSAFAWSVRFFALMSCIGLASLILFMDPESVSWSAFLFLGLGFLAVSSLAAWGLEVLYRRFLGEEGVLRFWRRLLQQAILCGVLMTIWMTLVYFRAFEWWTAGLGFVLILLIELTLRKRQSIS